MSVLLISGSPSPTSSGARLLHHIGERLASHGHLCTRLQVRDLPAAPLLHGDASDAVLARALIEGRVARGVEQLSSELFAPALRRPHGLPQPGLVPV